MDGNGTKVQVEDLVKTRNRKLIELYCMSRLNELLEIKNQRLLKGEIDTFLQKNDITKGIRFDSSTLPKFSHVGPTLAPANSAPSSAGSAGSCQANGLPPRRGLSGIRKKDGTVGSAANLDRQGSQGVKTELKRALTDVHSADEPSSKRIKVERDTVSVGTENKADSASISSMPRSVSSTNEIVNNRSASIYNSPPPVDPNPPVAFRDIEIPPADPTPVGQAKRYSNYLVEEASRHAPESVEYFNESDINSKESVFLLMKEIVPSKVAQALPLAELKYMVQTLPLIKLIPMAHKALTTDIMNNALSEGRITVVSSRIEELRRLGLWSLRQPKKFCDAWQEDVSHHRTLIEEAKWMQADFKEGQKYKVAVCTTIAHAVMEYWVYGKVCCVRLRSRESSHSQDAEVGSAQVALGSDEVQKDGEQPSSSFGEEVEAGEAISNMSVPGERANKMPAESAESDEVLPETKITSLDNEKEEGAEDQALNGIEPRYDKLSTSGIVASDENEEFAPDIKKAEDERKYLTKHKETKKNQELSENIKETEKPQATVEDISDGIDTKLLWERPDASQEIVPPKLPEISYSEFARYKQESANQPFKLYLSFDELNSTVRTIAEEIPLYTGFQAESDEEKLSFVPVSKSLVTLEDDHFYKLVEKQIIDDEQSLVQLSKRRGMFYGNRRSHYLKPPPAPSLRYLQNRTPTIWLPEDDQELVKNINAYAYNWELISAHMTRRPTMSYFSNIERRTPWQCFERFVQLNERFSFSDLKGPRAHSVQAWLMEAHKFQQKQNRRISPLGVGPESIQRGHRRLRWASMFEAIRKCIKKRENAPRPNPTQPRKPLDCKNMKVPTPAEMSQLKAQRDEALRREIQMRRNVKSRLQQSSQSSPVMSHGRPGAKMAAPSGDHSPNTSGISTSGQIAKGPADKQKPKSAFPQKRFTEREIIESYSKRILAQKPELSMETAMRAAQSYYRAGQQRKMQLQQQQQQQIQRKEAQSHSAPALGQLPEQQEQIARGMSSTLLGTSNSAPNPKVDSPTPQEILDRLHK